VADPVNSREAPRVAVEAFVKADSDDGKEYNFRTRDLSTSGVFLYSRISHAYPFKVGSRLQLELVHDDLQVRCAVVVVRIVEQGSQESKTYPTGFGVRIVEIDEEARGRIDAMVKRLA
jgi:c-di-GMP-binding flagellar brake protein YcgR